MEISVDVAIIGAGSAGLAAFKEASKLTKNILLIDHGPLGTTCARAGCMPSKTLIQVADFFHERLQFNEQGILGADNLKVDMPAVLQYVRNMRDSFTSGIIDYIESLGDQFIHGNAELVEPHIIKVNDKIITARSIIIAVGTESIVPPEWQAYTKSILTAENIFEQTNLEKKMAVIGGGPIGLELGQALSRLGIEVSMFHSQPFISGLSDPVVNEAAIKIMRSEFHLHICSKARMAKKDNSLLISSDDYQFSADQVLVAIGRKSNLDKLNLEKMGITAKKATHELVDSSTLQVGQKNIYIAGDDRDAIPILHEAADDGHIAGYNAVRAKSYCFTRRVPLFIVFTQPNIAVVGQSFKELQGKNFVIGEVSFEDQGRSRIMRQNKGVLRIYADKETGMLLGAEMIAPDAEYMAHMLAWQIQQKMTVSDTLQLPYYHPVILEGMRTALRHLADQVSKKARSFELAMCDSEPSANLI